MADIDQIIAGGAGSTSRGDFSGIGDLAEAYWKGKDRQNVQQTRDLFKGGVPKNDDGSINYGAMRDALFKQGDIAQGTSIDNLDLARQKLKYGQQLNEQVWPSGGQPQSDAPILPPSANRSASAPVAPALNPGGTGQPAQGAPGAASPQQPGAPTGGQPTVMKILAAQGVPNDQLGAASASLSRQLGIDDPTQPIDINDPRVRNVVGGFVRQIKTAGVGNIIPPGQAAPNQQIQPPPQVMGPGGAAQPNAQGVYPSNAVMMPQGQPPVVAQGGAPPQPGAPPGPPQPGPQPPPQAQPPAGIPASQAPTDPTLGGLVPKGRTPEQQLTLLRRAVGTGLLDPNVEKVYLEQIKSLETRLAPTDQEKAFDAARRNPGLDPYTARTKAQEAAATTTATEDAKNSAKRYEGIVETGVKAQREIPQLAMLQEQMKNDPNFFSGAGEKYNLLYKRLKSAIGMDPDAPVPQEMLRKVMASNVLSAFGELKGLGPIRVAEMKLAQQAVAAPENSIPANQILVEISKRTHERNAEIADMAQAYKQKNGALDAGFDKQVTDLFKRKPMISDAEIKDWHNIIGQQKTPAASTTTASANPYEAEMRRRGLLK